MKIVLIFLICLFCLPVLAQKSNRKLKEIKDQYSTCKYTIEKKSKLKEGEFLRIKNNTKDTLVIGQYASDQKIGVWKYRRPGNKDYISFNHDNQSVEYLDPSITKIDSFLIKENTDGLYLLNKVDSPPIYLGFKGEINTIMQRNLTLTPEECQRGIKGFTTASFVIDSTGRISEIMIVKSLGKSIDRMVVNAIKMIDGQWIPAKVNHVPKNAQMEVLFSIHGPGNYPKLKEKPYQIIRDFSYFGVQRTYSTSRIVRVPVSMPMGAPSTF